VAVGESRQKRSNRSSGKQEGRRAKKPPSNQRRRTSPRVDVGIITIRDDEFDAILEAFPEKAGVYQKRREYTLRWADAGGGEKYCIAILRQIEQGNGEAQEAARDLLDDLNPALLLVVGIGGALPSDDITLGDVALATRVNDYSVEARKEGADPTYNLSGGPIAKKIAAGVANLAGRADDLGDWNQHLSARPLVSWTDSGQLYGPTDWQNEVRQKLEFHFGPNAKVRPPRFKAGAIASSDRLVKDPAVLFPWIQTARHLLAVEMESGGVYRAARDRCLMLAIRGISDIVGLKRSNDWTMYACASAAAFARAYLRTKPIRPRSPSSGTTSPISEDPSSEKGQSSKTGRIDVLYANILPLRQFPKTIYVAPAKYGSFRECWAVLRKGAEGHVSEAWELHNKNVFSFVDPSTSRLSLIADIGAVEEHPSRDWSASSDPNNRRLFAHLLNGALRDDLDALGVWFFWRDEVFAFAGKPDADPRKVEYRNLHQRSTMTVVSHYQAKLKDGSVLPYLRHLGFRGRFRLYEDIWYLEVTPTYQFTTDGKKKYRFHESQLKGIKQLEKNRSVLSQLLLWSSVLRGEAARSSTDRPPLLVFGDPPTFRFQEGMSENEWIPLNEDDPSSVDEVSSSNIGEESEL
jgi:nucleoside phosphorylase